MLGLTPFEAGLWSIPPGLGCVLGSLLTTGLLRLMRPAHVLGLGLTLAASGLALMAHAGQGHSLLLIVLGNVIFSIGSAPGVAIAADLVVGAAPQDRTGAASALNETASEFGGAFGIAFLGSLATVLYRSSLRGTLPEGVAADAVETALRGIGAASGLALRIDDRALRSVAQDAYTRAARMTFSTGAAIMLVTAAIAVTMFRGLRKSDQ